MREWKCDSNGSNLRGDFFLVIQPLNFENLTIHLHPTIWWYSVWNIFKSKDPNISLFYSLSRFSNHYLFIFYLSNHFLTHTTHFNTLKLGMSMGPQSLIPCGEFLYQGMRPEPNLPPWGFKNGEKISLTGLAEKGFFLPTDGMRWHSLTQNSLLSSLSEIYI